MSLALLAGGSSISSSCAYYIFITQLEMVAILDLGRGYNGEEKREEENMEKWGVGWKQAMRQEKPHSAQCTIPGSRTTQTQLQSALLCNFIFSFSA